MVENHAFRDLEPREFGAAGCQHIGLGERGPRSRNDDTADLALAFVGQPDREGLTDCVVSGEEIFNLLGPRRRRSWDDDRVSQLEIAYLDHWRDGKLGHGESVNIVLAARPHGDITEANSPRLVDDMYHSIRQVVRSDQPVLH